MVLLIECETYGGGGANNDSENRICLRSDKQYSRVSTSRKRSLNFTLKKHNSLSSKTEYEQAKRVRFNRETLLKKIYVDMITKLGNVDIIREILVRLPWSLISYLNLACGMPLDWVSCPKFTARYLASKPFLLGFSYARKTYQREIYRQPKFISLPSALLCCPEYCTSLKQNIETPPTEEFYLHCWPSVPWNAIDSICDLRVCSTDGIILRNQLRGLSSFLSLQNPISGQSVFLPKAPPAYNVNAITFISYGLAIDFFSSEGPNVTIVELISLARIPDCRFLLQVNTFSSKTLTWVSKQHEVEPYLVKGYKLSWQGTHLNNVIYWLKKGSGIVAYDILSESFCFGLFDIPGEPIDDMCLCEKHNTSGIEEYLSFISNIGCKCRYLGVSEDRIYYIRVMNNSKILLWTLKCGKWSNGISYTLYGLPMSLSFGRIVCVDPHDCNLLYVRLKTKIFSYDLAFHDLKEIYNMILDDESDTIKDTIVPLFPFEAPKLPSTISNEACFKALFGSSLCFKDTCWGNRYSKLMVLPDAHVHSTMEKANWIECQSVPDYRRYYYPESEREIIATRGWIQAVARTTLVPARV